MEVHPGLCQGVIKTDTKSLLPRVPVPFGGSLQGPMTCALVKSLLWAGGHQSFVFLMQILHVGRHLPVFTEVGE